MALERELETYQLKLPELKAEEGKFVVIQGEEVAGAYTSAEDAIKAGYERYKLEQFLVKQIRAVELVQLISRFVAPHAAM